MLLLSRLALCHAPGSVLRSGLGTGKCKHLVARAGSSRLLQSAWAASFVSLSVIVSDPQAGFMHVCETPKQRLCMW